MKQRITWVTTAAGVLLWAIAQTATAGTIANSAHDFTTSANGNFSTDRLCVACHVPHGGTSGDTPLWNHTNSTKTYQLYNSTVSSTMNATPSQPAATSKMCLSCHDGSVAVDSFGGTVGSRMISAANNIGGSTGDDLKNDHPIGITYDATLIAADGALNVLSTAVTIGSTSNGQTKDGTLSSLLLYNGKVECASCHDVHNTFAIDGTVGKGLVKMSQSTHVSQTNLCLACHKK